MTLRKLTSQEIEKLASKKGVRRIAVKNFLMTVHNNKSVYTACTNLRLDKKLYEWNIATEVAIREGIALATQVNVEVVSQIKELAREP